MAHAGTPTDLAQKPATSTNGLWQALLAVIVILALGVGMALIAANVAPKSVAAPAADGYTQVEANRGATTFAAADGSYTQVETNRGGAFSTADGSYTQVENNRGGALTGGNPTKIGGSAPENGPGRIVGHRGALIDQ